MTDIFKEFSNNGLLAGEGIRAEEERGGKAGWRGGGGGETKQKNWLYFSFFEHMKIR